MTRSTAIRFAWLLLATALVLPASAQAAPVARVARGDAQAGQDPQALAAHGTRLVQIINARDADAFAERIDAPALGRRIVDGLGMADGVRRDFLAGFVGARAKMAANALAQIEHNHGVARLVRSRAAGGGSRQIVRVDQFDAEGAAAGYEYFEFELDAQGRIGDWISHAQGMRASELMRRLSVMMIDDGAMLARVFGITRIDEATLALVETLGRQLRALDHAGAYATLERLPEEFRRGHAWASLRTTMAVNMDEATYRRSLQHLADHHGALPQLQFMLIDHYHFRGEHDKVIVAIEGFERAVVEDGVTTMLKCVAAMQAEATQPAAIGHCRRSLALEPEAEDTWWLLVTVALQRRDAALVLDTLADYERQFDMQFDPDKLLQQDGYDWLAGEPAFAAWAKARR